MASQTLLTELLALRTQVSQLEQLAFSKYSCAQTELLLLLMQHGPSTISFLAKTRKVKKSTMSQQVNEMIEQGLVFLAKSKTDKRVKLVVLKAKGKQYLVDVEQSLIDQQHKIEAFIEKHIAPQVNALAQNK